MDLSKKEKCNKKLLKGVIFIRVNSFHLQGVVKMCGVFQSYQQDFQALRGFHQPGDCLRDQEFGGY
jgi:hypothetical protein